MRRRMLLSMLGARRGSRSVVALRIRDQEMRRWRLRSMSRCVLLYSMAAAVSESFGSLRRFIALGWVKPGDVGSSGQCAPPASVACLCNTATTRTFAPHVRLARLGAYTSLEHASYSYTRAIPQLRAALGRGLHHGHIPSRREAVADSDSGSQVMLYMPEKYRHAKTAPLDSDHCRIQPRMQRLDAEAEQGTTDGNQLPKTASNQQCLASTDLLQ